MKVVAAETLGSLEQYKLVETERPVPGPGQVLVRVRACSIGHVDSLLALGKYQVKPQLPHVPGQEVSGVVEGVGGGVSRIKAGDRVFGITQKGLSEYVCLSEKAVYVIPDRMTFASAACLPINYMTALHGLRDRGFLVPGETVLVFGAAGGLGTAAIHVAKAVGAHVVAVASTDEKRSFALSAGADAVLDTDPDGWRERLSKTMGGQKPNVVFDPVCGPLFEHAFRSIAWRGRYLVVGFAGGSIPALPANLPLMKGASLTGVDVRQYMMFESHRLNADFEQILKWVEAGQFIPLVGPEYAFEQSADALAAALSGKVQGKAVVQVSGA